MFYNNNHLGQAYSFKIITYIFSLLLNFDL